MGNAEHWDYLIVSAANDAQASLYDYELGKRCGRGELQEFERVRAIADPGGRRIGSGGSIFEILKWIADDILGDDCCVPEREALLGAFAYERILIVHAGGDAKRLPAFSRRGKAFIPLGNPDESGHEDTVFDRQVAQIVEHCATMIDPRRGQIVMVNGDALVELGDLGPSIAANLRMMDADAVALGVEMSMDEGERHGVFGWSTAEQTDAPLIMLHNVDYLEMPELPEGVSLFDDEERLIGDTGMVVFDGNVAAACIDMLDDMKIEGISSIPLNWYNEIQGAMIYDNCDHYLEAMDWNGSDCSREFLTCVYDKFRKFSFRVEASSEIEFSHFGTTADLLEQAGRRRTPAINCVFGSAATLPREGHEVYIEGCQVGVTPRGGPGHLLRNVPITERLELPDRCCIDIVRGERPPAAAWGSPSSEYVWFARFYGVYDDFKRTLADGGTWCHTFLFQFLHEVAPDCGGDIKGKLWPERLGGDSRPYQLWEAKLFPALAAPEEFRDWLWMLEPLKATERQIEKWLRAERYSMADIAAMPIVKEEEQCQMSG